MMMGDGVMMDWTMLDADDIREMENAEHGVTLDAIGLPAVRDDGVVWQVCEFMRGRGVNVFENATIVGLADDVCPECDSHPSDVPAEWHPSAAPLDAPWIKTPFGMVAGDGAILIGCEGYQTPVFRAIASAMRRGGLIVGAA